MMGLLATGAAISIPRYIGLVLPPRQVDGVVTGLYTKKYGGKYQQDDNTLQYAVIGGTSYLLNNDRSPYDLRVGDHVQCQCHAGMNEVLKVQWIDPEGAVRDRPLHGGGRARGSDPAVEPIPANSYGAMARATIRWVRTVTAGAGLSQCRWSWDAGRSG